jgi:hypothetical protein
LLVPKVRSARDCQTRYKSGSIGPRSHAEQRSKFQSPIRSKLNSPPLDSAHHARAFSTAHGEVIKLQMLQQVEQRDAISLPQLAFLLPEASNDLTISGDPLSLTDSVGALW